MKVLRVIACGSKKRKGFHKAKDLYLGGLFILARRWAEQSQGNWAILSAKHGLLFPDEIVESYDYTFKKAPKDWIIKVGTILTQFDQILIAAPKRYVKPFMGYRNVYPVFQIAKCKGIGYQQQWLKEHTFNLEEEKIDE